VNGKNGKHGSLIAYRGDPSIELATWQQKTSLIAECYRAVLTSILFSSQQGEIPKVIVLSSPDPGEGKTSTVSNLGIALAEINRRVVIVDGDMRRPRLHRVFGLTGSKGLTDLLRSEKPIDQYPIESLVHPTEVPGLYVLPGGSGAVNISNLLYSPRMPELLERLRSEFDTVLIDSPPMLQIPDARVLGRMADGVVLVVRAGQTRRDSAVTASQRFAEDHTRVLGTILNHWDPRNSNAGYDGYHEYYKSASV
jgi:receptor protein-tyrosine kinase